MFTYEMSIFLTSTAFVATNTKYGIPLSRYTVFLQNCPLERGSKATVFFSKIIFHYLNIVLLKLNYISCKVNCILAYRVVFVLVYNFGGIGDTHG